MNSFERYLIEHPAKPEQSPSRLLREIAYERLKDAMKNAEHRPGEHLSEVRLSEILGISRTPVREAVQQLAQEGLLQIVPGRAVVIPFLSVVEIRDLVHMRLLLEPEVARLATQCATRSQVESLQTCCARMLKAAEADDRTSWTKADSRFHDTLTQLCPNEILGNMARQIANRIHHLAIAASAPQGRLIECTHEHSAVADAIATGDGDRAARAMTEHLEIMRHNLANTFRW